MATNWTILYINLTIFAGRLSDPTQEEDNTFRTVHRRGGLGDARTVSSIFAGMPVPKNVLHDHNGQRDITILVCLSVCPSVSDVDDLWS